MIPQVSDGVSDPTNGTQDELPSTGSIIPATVVKVLSSLEKIEREIERALSLDLKEVPRYSRKNNLKKLPFLPLKVRQRI